MLVNESYDYSNILDDLGFYPDIYSPNFKNLTFEIVKKIHEKKNSDYSLDCKLL